MLIKTFSGMQMYVEGVTKVQDVIDHVRDSDNIPDDVILRCEVHGKPVPRESSLDNCDSIFVTLSGGLPGGKGGFGSLLRSIGAQIEKTTNHEAMRDLSGRRQRDVNNEERLKKYVSGAAEREKIAREKKEEKMEKLRRLAEGENIDKRGFSDPVYDKVRSETEEKVHAAMEAALASSSSSKNSDSKDANDNKDKNLKRKSDGDKEKVVNKKPKGLWLGEGLEDLDDSDLSNSESEEETTKSSAV